MAGTNRCVSDFFVWLAGLAGWAGWTGWAGWIGRAWHEKRLFTKKSETQRLVPVAGTNRCVSDFLVWLAGWTGWAGWAGWLASSHWGPV